MKCYRIRPTYVVALALFIFYIFMVDIKFLLKGEYASKDLKSQCNKRHTFPLTITSITKNSALFIREWLEYHLLIGVDHFYLLDNESEDNLKEVLQPYIERGLVTYIPWQDGEYRDAKLYLTLNTQQKGIVYALSLYGCNSEWTALIDDDEFIVPKDNRSLKAILKDYEGYGGLAVGWAWFGSNNHTTKPNSLVIEAYTKRRDTLDILYKTIIQPRYFKRMKTIHYPVFDSSHPLVTEHYNVVSTLPEHIKGMAYSLNKPTSDIIQLNHYKVKSWEEWLERVGNRGAVAGSRWRDTVKDFNTWDYNDVTDTSILKFVPVLLERLKG